MCLWVHRPDTWGALWVAFICMPGESHRRRLRSFLFLLLLFCYYYCYFFSNALSLVGNSGRSSCKSSATHSIPIGECSIFLCPNNSVADRFGIENVRADDACDCTRGLYGHRQTVCTGSWLGEKSLNALGTRTRVSITPSLSFHWDALPTKLSLPCRYVGVTFFELLTPFVCCFSCLVDLSAVFSPVSEGILYRRLKHTKGYVVYMSASCWYSVQKVKTHEGLFLQHSPQMHQHQ